MQLQTPQNEEYLKHQTSFSQIQLPNTEPTPPSTIKLPNVDLKPLPQHLRYTFFRENQTLPVIISSKLTQNQEDLLVRILKRRIREMPSTIS